MWAFESHISTDFYILAAPCGMWDLSSLTRDLTATPVFKVGSINHWTTREVTQINFLQLTLQIMIFFTLTREYTNSEFLKKHKEAILNQKKRERERENKVNTVGPSQRARKIKDQHPNPMTGMPWGHLNSATSWAGFISKAKNSLKSLLLHDTTVWQWKLHTRPQRLDRNFSDIKGTLLLKRNFRIKRNIQKPIKQGR